MNCYCHSYHILFFICDWNMITQRLIICSCISHTVCSRPLLKYMSFCFFSCKWTEFVQKIDHWNYEFKHSSGDNRWPWQPTPSWPGAWSDSCGRLQPYSSSTRLLSYYAEGFRQRRKCGWMWFVLIMFNFEMLISCKHLFSQVRALIFVWLKKMSFYIGYVIIIYVIIVFIYYHLYFLPQSVLQV